MNNDINNFMNVIKDEAEELLRCNNNILNKIRGGGGDDGERGGKKANEKEEIASKTASHSSPTHAIPTKAPKGIEHLSELLNLALTRRIILMGVGKSGLIAQKIASTLSSTGSPSIFIHPTEALHGDLGNINKEDIILLISYSGESSEIVILLPHLKKLSHSIVTMTSSASSSISREGDYFIDISVTKEACPLNVAPTSSSTLTLALGDALAVSLMKKRNFKKEDFAIFHPGGSLGRRLALRIKDVMRTKDIPSISEDAKLKEAIIAMSEGKLGNVLILSQDGRLRGLLSDGDLRRALLSPSFNLEDMATKYATLNPKVFKDENLLAYEALSFIEENKIQLLVLVNDEGMVRGVLHLHTLIELGLNAL